MRNWKVSTAATTTQGVKANMATWAGRGFSAIRCRAARRTVKNSVHGHAGHRDGEPHQAQRNAAGHRQPQDVGKVQRIQEPVTDPATQENQQPPTIAAVPGSSVKSVAVSMMRWISRMRA